MGDRFEEEEEVGREGEEQEVKVLFDSNHSWLYHCLGLMTAKLPLTDF